MDLPKAILIGILLAMLAAFGYVVAVTDRYTNDGLATIFGSKVIDFAEQVYRFERKIDIPMPKHRNNIITIIPAMEGLETANCETSVYFPAPRKPEKFRQVNTETFRVGEQNRFVSQYVTLVVYQGAPIDFPAHYSIENLREIGMGQSYFDNRLERVLPGYELGVSHIICEGYTISTLQMNEI